MLLSMQMSVKTSHAVLTFLMSFVAGAVTSAVLMFAAVVVLFGLGARTGNPYAFSIGPWLVFQIDVSEGNLGMVFGLGFPAIAFLLGLMNALVATILKTRGPLKRQSPSH